MSDLIFIGIGLFCGSTITAAMFLLRRKDTEPITYLRVFDAAFMMKAGASASPEEAEAFAVGAVMAYKRLAQRLNGMNADSTDC